MKGFVSAIVMVMFVAFAACGGSQPAQSSPSGAGSASGSADASAAPADGSAPASSAAP